MLENKFQFETLPVTKAFLREKRLIQDRGELVLLSDGEEIRHLTFFTLNPGNGYFRGGHYHRKKTEKFYLVSGKMRLLLVDVETEESAVLDLDAGCRVTLKPMCAHKFVALRLSQVIEYYAKPFDLSDDIRYDKFNGE
jgi:dTDP-4-dehydrorhamnose 3,5-epimerase-like enzyme